MPGDSVVDEGKNLRKAADAVSSDALDDALGLVVGARSDDNDQPEDQSGETVGRYKLLEKIGEGGFGIVYLAEQQEPICRKVALKIIKQGMDTRQVVARFEAERQALAMMEHENIANVLDAGATAAGRPYFVMELVSGITITDYSDHNRLNIHERLKLFISVCKAIQHAHQKGIIHRDLKPGNVMVTLRDGEPVPKVIDFGVAKAIESSLTDKTLFTRYGQFIGTPVYMSPEQAEMSEMDIDTRSDIYSLGVLLYELLTGSAPLKSERFKRASYTEIQKMICQHEPMKPSAKLGRSGTALDFISFSRATGSKQLRQLMRGDLDWIVMKSLEKDRARRYETANELGEDVRRYLLDESIVARPPSTVYKSQKFARKHWKLLSTSVLILVVLLAATTVSTVMALRAKQAEAQANNERDTASLAQKEADILRSESDKQRERMRWNLYCAEMKGAKQVFRMPKGPSRCSKLLEKWREDAPELLGWEWYYLNSLLHRELKTLSGHEDFVSAVSYSPDGSRLATASHDRTVRIWDVETYECLHIINGHQGEVHSVCWSPDSRSLASAGTDLTIKIWNVANGNEVDSLLGHTGKVWSLSWHPHGKWLASASEDRTVRVWEVEIGQQKKVLEGHVFDVTAVTWSPDGSILVSGGKDDTILIWDTTTWEHREPLAYRYGVQSLAFNDSGTKLATTSFYESNVDVLNIEAALETTSLLGHTNYSYKTAWNSDCSRLVSAGHDSSLRIWNTATAKLEKTIYTDQPTSVSWSPNQGQFASGGRNGLVRIWSSANSQGPIKIVENNLDYWSARWNHDGDKIAFVSQDNTVHIWDATSGEIESIGEHEHSLFAVNWSSDGRLATGGRDGHVKIYDVTTGHLLHSLSCESNVWSVAWSPDSMRIAAACEDATAKVWDTSAGELLLTFEGHDDCLKAIRWHPDGTCVASAGIDGTVKIWNSESGQTIWSTVCDTEQVNGLSWDPNGKWLAASTADDTDIKILHADNGKLFRRLVGHTEWVFSASWNPNGKRLASASADGTVKIWDSLTGVETLTLRDHTHFVRSVDWHPDGLRLASTGRDGTVLIWDSSRGYRRESDH